MKEIIKNILVLMVIFLVIFIAYQKKSYEKIISSEGLRNNVSHQYDCSFIKTYRVVNLLSNYIAEVPEWSYIVVDQFQNPNVIALKVPTKLKEGLKEGKYYEFKYKIVGTGIVDSMEDINKYITLDEIIINRIDENVKVYLTIIETSDEGLDQIQQKICKSISPMIID